MASKIDAEALAKAMEEKKQAHIAAKKEEERKKVERQKVITERIGTIADFEGLEVDKLKDLMGIYWARAHELDSHNYDMERKCMVDGIELDDLKKKVMDLRGKFILPTLKKVTVEFDD